MDVSDLYTMNQTLSVRRVPSRSVCSARTSRRRVAGERRFGGSSLADAFLRAELEFPRDSSKLPSCQRSRSAPYLVAPMNESFTAEEDGTLLPFLFEKLPDVKRTKVRQWLKFDGIQVNGAVAKLSTHPLKAGDVVMLAPTPKAAAHPDLPAGMKLIYEDDDVIVIMKPAKLLSIAANKPDQATAYSELLKHVSETRQGGRDRVWIVHRLDRDTSGLMVFAQSEEAKLALQENWKAAEKKYLAVVDGLPPEKSGTLRSHLDESNSLRVRSVRASNDTREAITHYEVLRKTEKRAVLQLTLDTGRRHQIRVQLAELGCPIVGDERYHPDSDIPKAERPIESRPKRMALHAAELRFIHPNTGELMEFTSGLPGDMANMMKSSDRQNRRRKAYKASKGR